MIHGVSDPHFMRCEWDMNHKSPESECSCEKEASSQYDTQPRGTLERRRHTLRFRSKPRSLALAHPATLPSARLQNHLEQETRQHADDDGETEQRQDRGGLAAPQVRESAGSTGRIGHPQGPEKDPVQDPQEQPCSDQNAEQRQRGGHGR